LPKATKSKFVSTRMEAEQVYIVMMLICDGA